MNNAIILLPRAVRRALDTVRFKIRYQIHIRKYQNPDYAIIASSSLFNADWYLFHYEDVRNAGVDPVHHYIVSGWVEGRNPSVYFDGNSYLKIHPEVAEAGINPLLHYEKHGRSGEWKDFNRRSSFLPSLKHAFVQLLNDKPLPETPVRMIAFYLPQFHEIPENNAWWGKGFTEWTNVRRGRPLFKGHYQPRIPGELGYYDLTDKKIMKRQTELARLYGIGGFCFYFYWFDGKRLLEQPLLDYLDEQSVDFPFCLCWANENWTRAWDGKDSEVLISQHHSPEDDVRFIQHVSRYFQDKRYIRIEGKPLLVVYRPGILPDAKATSDRWREWARSNGFGDIYLAYVQSFSTQLDPAVMGYDAAIEFPPDKTFDPRVHQGIRPRGGNKFLHVYDWTLNAEKMEADSNPEYKLFRGVCPSWDNTPRRKSAGAILVNNTPERFSQWVADAAADTIKRFGQSPDERLIFVNAWNEWAEGAYLEPDMKYGYAWLQSVRNALSLFSQLTAPVFDRGRKKVLFDLLFCQAGFHGGGEYGKAVFRALVARVTERTDWVLYVAMNPGFSIDGSILELCAQHPDHIRTIRVNDLNDIRRLVNTDLFDTFFAPGLVVYSKGYRYMKTAGREMGFRCNRTRVTGTLHDIRDMELAQDYGKIHQFRKTIGCKLENRLSASEMENSDRAFREYAAGLKTMYQEILDDRRLKHIITVSDYSLQSMRDHLNVSDETAGKIHVLYSCMKHRYPPQPLAHPGADFNTLKFLLSINLGRVEKNGSAIARAIDELMSEKALPADLFAVLTGIENLKDLDIEIRNRDRFITLGFLQPENLEFLYSRAACLVYASLSEGFGYPPIEAMSYRVPSVVARITALPEICGEAAVYCDPYNLASVKQAILQSVSQPPSEEVLQRRYEFITSRQAGDLDKLTEIILT